MTFSPLRSLRATSIKHHDRGLTLVFGSDGQVSLIGFDGGIASQPLEVPPTLTASNTDSLTPGTHSLPSASTSVSPVPNLEATSASLTGTSSFTPTSTNTAAASSLVSSSYDLSSTATDTDTNLPSVPTVNYPTPSPTAVSNPKDHGVGAPFYLAIVLASISFVGCVAAFIAWWIRSRARKRDLELDDPWHHHDSISDAGSPFTENVNGFEKGAYTDMESQTQPYYLPSSIVRRSSSNLLAVPHAIPTLEEAKPQHSIPPTAPVAGRYPYLGRVNDPRSQNPSSQPIPHQNMPSSQTTNLYSRPGTVRLQTGLSVQESTRTLGRLRVANRMPGDVTSGDEGGVNIPRLLNSARVSPVANTGGPNTAPVGQNAIQNTQFDQSDRSLQEGEALLEPPGPATLSWGRRTDTVAALRRTRRRTPETTVQTYQNARYGGYLYPTSDGGPSGMMSQAQAPMNQEENDKVLANLPHDPLGWTKTLKSSFWLAVDAMAGNRSSGLEPLTGNAGGGSKFTPAPQRAASRRSPVSPISSSLLGTRTARSEEEETKYELTPPAQETRQSSTHSRPGSSLTLTNGLEVPHINENNIGRVDSLTPKVSHLNRNLSASVNPDSLRTDTGSVYSTDSAAARANLRKYGYGDSIPSSWSALGASRESQLDLDRMYLPLPRPISSSSPGSLSIKPLHITSESSLQSDSMRTHTHTPTQSRSDVMGSDDGTLRSGKSVNTASYVEATTSSMYSMSRNGTMQSGLSSIGLGTLPSQTSSTTSSMLSRKKGVTTRRKRPRPPARAPSTASSMQSMESVLSIRDVAVRRALLERRKKAKATGSLGGGEDTLMHSRDATSLLV
ncbi:hypothetical protein J3R82DRAFT_8566 [Butyriboletus roseoflavus]|nr:hypothetical protein J3R82DRAFT_8566 [Butyriboletus roseoflavus]